MNKILIFSNEERNREELKLILSDLRELILTDSLEQTQEVIKHTEIDILFTEKKDVQKFSENTSIKVFPIVRPIKKEEILKNIA